MKRTHAYLIAEKLYFNAAGNALCNRSWLFSVYKSLLIANANDTEEIKWTKYNQWKIDHNCRAAKAAAKKSKLTIKNFSLSIIDDDVASILVTFLKDNKMEDRLTCLYKRDSFLPALWTTKNPHLDTVLLSQYERDQLFESSIYSSDEFDVTEIENEVLDSPTKNSKKSKKGGKKESDEYVRKMKFTALNTLLDQIRDSYNQTKELNQRSYLEVVVGAAIFYLPSLNSHFNGFISVAALKGFLKGDRRVKDHIYPRKLAARELLSKKLTLEELIEKYHNHLATFMYITSSENSNLINYYETHENHDKAMKALDIEKFPTSEKEKFSSHKELNQFIETINAKDAQKMSAEELMQVLKEFRNQKLK
jgi:hypothetical protein